MNDHLISARIKDVAKEFDSVVERKDLERAMSYFSERCEIEMLGLTLEGKEGAKKWLEWLFSTFKEISFEPVTIMIDENTFFEEFVITGELKNGVMVTSKQAEVLVYKDYKIKSLRLYFDRMDFAEVMGKGPIKRTLIKMIKNASLKDLK